MKLLGLFCSEINMQWLSTVHICPYDCDCSLRLQLCSRSPQQSISESNISKVHLESPKGDCQCALIRLHPAHVDAIPKQPDHAQIFQERDMFFCPPISIHFWALANSASLGDSCRSHLSSRSIDKIMPHIRRGGSSIFGADTWSGLKQAV